MTRFLDEAIVRAQRLPYHPYLVATDVSAAATLVLAMVFARRVPGFSFGAFLLAFAAMQASYAGFLRVKARIVGTRSRSFLQDTLVVLLPTYAAASVLAGNRLAAALDFAGLALPLGLAILRVGCFLGGCCYGLPSARGVRYPPELLVPVRGCRSYSPGAVPEGRVFPIQLVEAGIAAVLFLALGARVAFRGADGRVLPTFLLAYALARAATDFRRRESARPRIGPFSEAQVVAAAVAVVASAALVLWEP